MRKLIKKLFILSLFMQCSSYLVGQSEEVVLPLNLTENLIENPVFHFYSKPYTVKKAYAAKRQARNKTPEALMASILSTTNQDWVDYNTYGGAEKSKKKKPEFFNFTKAMNVDKNFMNLESKLTFKKEGKDYAFVKFKYTRERLQPISGCLLLIKENGRWYKTQSSLLQLNFLIVQFNSKILFEVLNQKKNKNPLHNKLIDKIFEGDKLNLQVLLDEYYSWDREKNKEEIAYFLESMNWEFK